MTAQHTTAAKTLTDQIRYCDRCGISFLWSAEEQRIAAATAGAAPSYCAGCRALLPEAACERGLVKWYNARKRFGFIVRHDQPEIFAHGSEVEGGTRLRPGDLVEFSVGTTARGPAAQAIRIIKPQAVPDMEV
jgi:cold shock protein